MVYKFLLVIPNSLERLLVFQEVHYAWFLFIYSSSFSSSNRMMKRKEMSPKTRKSQSIICVSSLVMVDPLCLFFHPSCSLHYLSLNNWVPYLQETKRKIKRTKTTGPNLMMSAVRLYAASKPNRFLTSLLFLIINSYTNKR